MARLLLALLLAAAARAGEPDRLLLEAQGIAAEKETLGRYLSALRPGESERAEALAAVRELGADDPGIRHGALMKLSALAAPPLRAIREAAESGDVEVRRIAARLLEESLRRIRKDVLHAVLRTVADAGLKGLAREVLGAAPLAAEMQMLPSVAAALRATLLPEDLAMLRAAAAEADPEIRWAAVRALGAAPGAAPDEAAGYLAAEDERLRLAGALAFADRGDRRCLEPLLALLDAEASPVRRGAADALRAACGGGLGYDAFADAEGRRRAVAAWRAHVAALPADARWEHPLPVGSRQLGRTLISLYMQKKVIEVDAEGRRTFEASRLEGPWAVQGLPNGHRLVALHPQRTILEYDAEGKEAARLALPGQPGGFQRLDNGNTLVAIIDQGRVVELRPDGTIARDFPVRGAPIDVSLLESGNLLVCLTGPARVVEIDRAGQVRWSLEGGFAYASTARRLENGNTLVAETAGEGRALEFDPNGQVVWERKGLQQCYSAERLPDGSTLIADRQGVREIAPDGTERWLHKVATFARACRY